MECTPFSDVWIVRSRKIKIKIKSDRLDELVDITGSGSSHPDLFHAVEMSTLGKQKAFIHIIVIKIVSQGGCLKRGSEVVDLSFLELQPWFLNSH